MVNYDTLIRRTFLILFSIVMTLTIFPLPALATTVSTVTSPNGGELVSGTYPITWTVRDTDYNGNIFFDLYYSYSAGIKNFLIAQNLSSNTYCSLGSISEVTLMQNSSIDYNKGLPVTSLVAASAFKIWEYGGDKYLSYFYTMDNNFITYKWNVGSASWVDVSNDFNHFSPIVGTTVIPAPFTIFTLGGKLYLITFLDSYTPKFRAWKFYNGTWVDNFDINVGLSINSRNLGYPYGIEWFIYNGNNYLLVSFNATGGSSNKSVTAFVWNGSTWTTFYPFNTFGGINYTTNPPVATNHINYNVFERNGDLYLFATTNYGAFESYKFNGSGWITDASIAAGFGGTGQFGATDNMGVGYTNITLVANNICSQAGCWFGGRFTFNPVQIWGVDYNLQTSTCSYDWNTRGANAGNWFVDLTAKGSSTVTDSSNASFLISNVSAGGLPITPIENVVSWSYDSNGVRLLSPVNPSGMIWKAKNNYTSSINARFILDVNIVGNKGAFVYTSTDGNTWTFSDTLTFGSTVYNPIQKIWDANSKTYNFSFINTLSVSETKYYKVVFLPLTKYWEAINSSGDWFNQNSPTNFFSGRKNYDVFADSNYTNIQSLTVQKFQNLVSTDFNSGYELQFTAYATTGANLLIGYRNSAGSDSTVTVTIGTTPATYSIPINPAARDSYLLIKSTNTTANTYYITDYAIVPRAYFYDQLEAFNPDYTVLQSILRNGVSSQYVLEGAQVRLKTSAFDTVGNLSQIEFQSFINSTMVEDQFVPITSFAGNFLNFNQLVDGIIDLNGIGGELVTSTALRQITYKVILWNSVNQKVSEQYKTISMLQYPYFPNDLRMTVDVLNTKIGSNPKIRFSVQQKVSQNFLGIDVAIYNSSHSLTTPNYFKRVYATDLGCVTLTNCTKELLFDDYVWESADKNFTVQVTALLSTENKNYTDAYANVTRKAIVTTSGYLLAQLKQYYERHQAAVPHSPYHSTEKIPLVFGLIDDAGKNLGDTVSPYFTLKINGSDNNTKYFPESFGYDETTGNNFWLWNQYLYKDDGNFLPQDANVFFRVTAVDKRQSQDANNQFAMAQRCLFYPADLVGNVADEVKTWWNGSIGTEIFNWQLHNNDISWIANATASILGSLTFYIDVNKQIGLNGCGFFGLYGSYPDLLVYPNSVSDSFLTIDNTYPVKADNRQALYCAQLVDNNRSVAKLGEDFECVLLVHADQEQIDQIHIQFGNDNSDYSVVNENKQYIDFTITANDVMWTDLSSLIRYWNQTGTQTNAITIQDVITGFLHNTFVREMSQEDIMKRYNFAGMIGGVSGNNDFNLILANNMYGLKADFNNDVYNKAIAFKVSGLSVINMEEYLLDTQVGQVSSTDFLSWARTNELNIKPKRATITIYNNSSKPYKVIETTSPIIINEKSSTPQQVIDSNGNIFTTTIPAYLPFHVISTMSSANMTKNSRLIANMYFNSIIKVNPRTGGNGGTGNPFVDIPDAINDLLYGETEDGVKIGLLNNPIGFMIFNWFWIAVLVGAVIIFSLVAMSTAPYFTRK